MVNMMWQTSSIAAYWGNHQEKRGHWKPNWSCLILSGLLLSGTAFNQSDTMDTNQKDSHHLVSLSHNFPCSGINEPLRSIFVLLRNTTLRDKEQYKPNSRQNSQQQQNLQ